MVESCSEEVTSLSLGAVLSIASGTDKAGCIQEERGAVICGAVMRQYQQIGFWSVSARHGLRTDLLLVSVLEMWASSTASLPSSCASRDARLGFGDCRVARVVACGVAVRVCEDLTDPRVGWSADSWFSVREQASGLGERDGGSPPPARAYPGVGPLSHPKVGAEV